MLDVISVTQNTYFKKFIKKFAGTDNWHELDPSRGDIGYGWIHYAMIRNMKPKRVLCVGSKHGFIPAICALACKHNDFGKVDFVDAGFSQDDPADQKSLKHWGGDGLWRRINPDKYFGKFGLSKFIDTYVMKTDSFYKKYAHQRKYGYLHLDGDHSYQGVKFDFDTFWPLLTKGGVCAFHDIYADEKNNPELGNFKYGVHKLWKKISSSKINTFEMSGKYGLGLAQK